MIILSCLFLCLLLFFPKVCLVGSKYGASLWLSQLLPTLLPFFIAIKLFQLSLPDFSSKRPFLLTGLLCGYPSGAALVTYQYERGILSQRAAYFYLGFVNNPSPMFILVFCCTNVLGLTMKDSLFCFAIVILSSLIGSSILYGITAGVKSFSSHPAASSQKAASDNRTDTPVNNLSEQLDRIILDSFVLMMKIGGYVILFSILGQCVHSLLPASSGFSGLLRILICGSLEITSGISYLQTSPLSAIAKKVLTITILAFGGFSAAAQTNSILAKSGLSLSFYLINKSINGLLAFLLSSLVFYIL